MGGRTASSGFSSGGATAQARVMVDGKDITETYTPPPEAIDKAFNRPMSSYIKDGKEVYLIEDIIHQQGFDGLPQVVSNEEFKKAVKASGIIAQRGYGAESQETLDKYHDQLINGEFYVRATGGTGYGRGMYCAADFNGKLSWQTEDTARNYAHRGGTKFNKIENLTLAPNAKIVSLRDLEREMDDNPELSKKFCNDPGAYAAAKGIDAARTGTGDSGFLVVYNRSKLYVPEE